MNVVNICWRFSDSLKLSTRRSRTQPLGRDWPSDFRILWYIIVSSPLEIIITRLVLWTFHFFPLARSIARPPLSKTLQNTFFAPLKHHHIGFYLSYSDSSVECVISTSLSTDRSKRPPFFVCFKANVLYNKGVRYYLSATMINWNKLVVFRWTSCFFLLDSVT